ncbi:MAG: radical SAM protein [Desulfobulbaceae bacterium]|nr:MAG: radical SAM protein [Desulfobulbaceae bacterium]
MKSFPEYLSEFRKNSGFFKSFMLRKPVWCSWQLTDKCNFRCKFCSVWRKEINHDQLSLSQVQEAAAKIARIGPMMVSMTGGEPLMRSDLTEIIATVDQHHFAFISTNGSLVTRERARELIQAGLWGVGISLDYADAAKHDEARGFPGAYQRALQALEIFQSEQVKGRPQVNLMFTLMHDNFPDLEELALITRDIGCTFRVQAYSALKTHDQSLQYPEPVSDKLIALQKKYPHFVTNRVILEKFDQAITEGVPGCIAGKYMINIDPRGFVSKCPEFQKDHIGHILEDDNRTLLARLRQEHKENRCRDCWYNCRNELEVSYSMRGMWFGKNRTGSKGQTG